MCNCIAGQIVNCMHMEEQLDQARLSEEKPLNRNISGRSCLAQVKNWCMCVKCMQSSKC